MAERKGIGGGAHLELGHRLFAVLPAARTQLWVLVEEVLGGGAKLARAALELPLGRGPSRHGPGDGGGASGCCGTVEMVLV